MTGYGKAKSRNQTLEFITEIKTINSKGLDISIRVPENFYALEIDARNIIATELSRGKIIVNISVVQLNAPSQNAIPTEGLLKLYRQLTDIQKELNISHPILLEVLAANPYLATPPIAETNTDDTNCFFDSLRQAISQVKQTRIQEGQTIQKQFENALENIISNFDRIPFWEKERIIAIKNKLLQQLNELKISIEKERFEQELIYYLEKLDITEEKKRIIAHLDFFAQTMLQEDQAGKKLTFIAQEIGREINTLGNKANHIDIQKLVVNMKDTLEQIKEQLANVV